MMHFGPVQFSPPKGLVQISDDHLAKLECALIWSSDGFAALAERTVADIERSLRDEADRLGRIAQARAARAAAFAVSRAEDPSTLNALDVDDLHKADDKREQARTLHAQAKAARDAGKRGRYSALRQQAKDAETEAAELARRVERRVRDRADRRAAGDALNAVVLTQAIRGADAEEVETYVSDFLRDEQGVLVKGENGLPVLRTEKATTRRVNEHTGLRLAFVNGDLDSPSEIRAAAARARKDEDERLADRLTARANAMAKSGTPNDLADDLYETGKDYASAFQTAEGVRTGEKSDVRMPPGPRGPQLAIAIATGHLIIFRGRGQGGTFLTPKQVQVLDLICGEDCSVKATAEHLHAGAPSIRKTLRTALSIARQNRITADKAKRGTPKTEASPMPASAHMWRDPAVRWEEAEEL